MARRRKTFAEPTNQLGALILDFMKRNSLTHESEFGQAIIDTGEVDGISSVNAKTIQKWITAGSHPLRRYHSALARVLDCTEWEVQQACHAPVRAIRSSQTKSGNVAVQGGTSGTKEPQSPNQTPGQSPTPWEIKGDDFGELSAWLKGPWQIYYVRPNHVAGSDISFCRGFVLNFRPSTPSTMAVEMITKERMVPGMAFVLDRHLYIILTYYDHGDVSFLNFGVPSYRFRYMAGAGNALSIVQSANSIAPTISFFTFGRQLKDDEFADKNWKAFYSSANSGNQFRSNELYFVRSHCCLEFGDADELKTHDTDLHDYVSNISINGTKGLQSCGLHIEYDR